MAASGAGIVAVVKKFNPVTGWGFLTMEDGNDVFFVRDDCLARWTANEGDAVIFERIEMRPDGKTKAVGVSLITPEMEDGSSNDATVKTFNQKSGWGFITTSDGTDAFFIRDDFWDPSFTPVIGDDIVYDEITTRGDGKLRAVGVRRAVGRGSDIHIPPAPTPWQAPVSGIYIPPLRQEVYIPPLRQVKRISAQFSRVVRPPKHEAWPPTPIGTISAGGAGGINAVVKTFNSTTGWGFLTTEHGQDVWFIRDDPLWNAQIGEPVVFDSIDQRDDGKLRATGVRPAATSLRAIVKTFNNQSGWGFLTTEDGTDVFFIRDDSVEGANFSAIPGTAVFYDGIDLRADGKTRAVGVSIDHEWAGGAGGKGVVQARQKHDGWWSSSGGVQLPKAKRQKLMPQW